MKNNRSLILDLHDKYLKDINFIKQNVNQKKEILNQNKKFNSTNTIVSNNIDKQLEQLHNKEDLEKNILYGIPYGLKDNICTSSILTTGGSNILSSYIPKYDATVYASLKKAKAILMCKETLDEYGMGATGFFNYTGTTINPIDSNIQVGGSSCGGVINVYTGATIFSIGTDTGDSVRRPASFLGVLGYKPTYGSISRFGIIPYAPSLDTVGIICKYVTDAAIVAQETFCYDTKDMTSQKNASVKLNELKQLPKIKFVVWKNLFEYLADEVRIEFEKAIELLKKNGHEIIYSDCDIDVLKFTHLAYFISVNTESYSCHSNKPSFIFTKDFSQSDASYDEYVWQNRTKGLGKEFKRRIGAWGYVAEENLFYDSFEHSLRLRTKIQEFQQEQLKLGDCILMPTSFDKAPSIEENLETADKQTELSKFKATYDDFLQIFNFTGAPCVSMPWIKLQNKYPVNIHVACSSFEDMKLLNICLTLENLFLGDENE